MCERGVFSDFLLRQRRVQKQFAAQTLTLHSITYNKLNIATWWAHFANAADAIHIHATQTPCWRNLWDKTHNDCNTFHLLFSL